MHACTSMQVMQDSCRLDVGGVCRPGVSALAVPRGVICIDTGRARVHPGEWHALPRGRRPPQRVDRRLPGRGARLPLLLPAPPATPSCNLVPV